jgi:hypothetical protein
MKTLNIELGTLNSRWTVVVLTLIACTLFSHDGSAQIQQAWVARYNNGITNGTNQAVKMALDSVGNIYVSGLSQNASSNLGYVTIKYAPNGNQVWATRYDSTNYPNATPAALVLDGSNDVIVTGSALTVKYDPNGNALWTAPYAGKALALDPSGDAYVTGFETNFNTVKLDPSGSNLWVTTYKDVGPTVGQAIVVDSNGNAYVSGSDVYGFDYPEPPFAQLLTIKYDVGGYQLWTVPQSYRGQVYGTSVEGAALDSDDNFYIVMQYNPYQECYETFKYSSNGSILWTASPESGNRNNTAHGLALNSSSNVLLVGQVFSNNYAESSAIGGFSTIDLSTDGSTLWTNFYLAGLSGSGSAGMAITIDSTNNVYVTGYSPGTNSSNDIVTIKYGPNGNQVWLQRYNGPGNGNDAGNAIAVDNNGNVYVTGYETTAAGGTEIVTIKYSSLALQRRADGTVLLQAQGSPGESFEIEASTDLQSWLDLGSVTADSNGLVQFDDTNASNYNARFYLTSPQ